MDVVHHHHGRVDHRSNGHSDAPQGHDIGGESLESHRNKRQQNGNGQGNTRYQSGAHVQ